MLLGMYNVHVFLTQITVLLSFMIYFVRICGVYDFDSNTQNKSLYLLSHLSLSLQLLLLDLKLI